MVNNHTQFPDAMAQGDYNSKKLDQSGTPPIDSSQMSVYAYPGLIEIERIKYAFSGQFLSNYGNAEQIIKVLIDVTNLHGLYNSTIRKRSGDIITSLSITMGLARFILPETVSLSRIGEIIARLIGRSTPYDHATVIHHTKQFKTRISHRFKNTYPEYYGTYCTIRHELITRSLVSPEIFNILEKE